MAYLLNMQGDVLAKQESDIVSGEILGNVSGKRLEIKKAVRFILDNLGSALTLGRIAAAVHLSEAYLSRIFKVEMNMNVMNYINLARVEMAKKLLRNKKISVEEIGQRVGYHRTSYFCKIFKQYNGMTPLKYRKNVILCNRCS